MDGKGENKVNFTAKGLICDENIYYILIFGHFLNVPMLGGHIEIKKF